MTYQYQRIADDLRQAIKNGTHSPGEPLPSEASLTRKYAVAQGTVRSAIRVLVNERLVETRHGKGVFVLDPSPYQGPDIDALLRRGLMAALRPYWTRTEEDLEQATDDLIIEVKRLGQELGSGAW